MTKLLHHHHRCQLYIKTVYESHNRDKASMPALQSAHYNLRKPIRRCSQIDLTVLETVDGLSTHLRQSSHEQSAVCNCLKSVF